MAQERRQHARMNLSLPVRVAGHDKGGAAWEEMATVDNVSASGAAVHLRHAVQPGQILHLLLPLPKRFRRYDMTEPSYRTYALARNVSPVGTAFRIGLMFLGKQAPRGYEKDPAGLFRLPNDPEANARKDRRQHHRLDIFVNVRLRLIDEGPGPREEQTIAENMSRGGARVMTSLVIDKGAVLELEEVDGDFRTRARVRNLYIGPDNIPRLNLEFLDGQAPDRLVATQG